MGAPEIAVGTAFDDADEMVIRLVFNVTGREQCIADMLPADALSMAQVLIDSARRVDHVEQVAYALKEADDARNGIAPLHKRLADCLARIIDEPLLAVLDSENGRDLPLRVGSFRHELANEACELLEEAGR